MILDKKLQRVLFVSIVLLFLSAGVKAQDITVTGTVVDAKEGEVLPGVNIAVKGTTSGTTTDANGKYELSAPSDAVLVFSFIGYKASQVPINGRKKIDVELSPTTESLEEVLVMGYTSQSKEKSTSSVVQVSGEELNDVTTTSATEALQGKASGVYVTSSSGEPGAETHQKLKLFD